MRRLLIAPLLLISCTSSTITNTAPGDISVLEAGEFHYIARSSAGRPLLTGRIEFVFRDDSTISGTWEIARLPGADKNAVVGPQIGSGTLVGNLRDGTLVVQLNPTNADHNVVLLATSNAHGYTGRWQWITIVGPQAEGPFEATPE